MKRIIASIVLITGLCAPMFGLAQDYAFSEKKEIFRQEITVGMSDREIRDILIYLSATIGLNDADQTTLLLRKIIPDIVRENISYSLSGMISETKDNRYTGKYFMRYYLIFDDNGILIWKHHVILMDE